MNPFYEGQSVICVNDSFVNSKGGDSINAPKKDEVLIVDEVMEEFVRFEKYDLHDNKQYWEYKNFAPLEDDIEDDIWIHEQINELVEHEELEMI